MRLNDIFSGGSSDGNVFGDLLGSGDNGSNGGGLGSALTGLGLNALQNLLGGFDLMGNLSNVLNYGLSSWGATHTPEGYKVHIKYWATLLANQVEQIKSGSLEHPLNELSKWIAWGEARHRYMRTNHAKAKSTKLAYDSGINFFVEQKNNLLLPIISEFEKMKLIGSRHSITEKVVPFYWDGKTVSSSDNNMTTTWMKYTIDTKRLDELNNVSNNEVKDNNAEYVGVNKNQGGSGMNILALGLLGWFMFK